MKRAAAVILSVVIVSGCAAEPQPDFLAGATRIGPPASAPKSTKMPLPPGFQLVPGPLPPGVDPGELKAGPLSSEASTPSPPFQPTLPRWYYCAGEGPAFGAAFDAELHAVCDEDVNPVIAYALASKDPKEVEFGRRWKEDWNCWKYFPDRWGDCRNLEQRDCKGDPSKLYPPHPDDCKKVEQLDGLMQRYEAAYQEENRDNTAERLEIERENAAPLSPAGITDCYSDRLGLHCYSF